MIASTCRWPHAATTMTHLPLNVALLILCCFSCALSQIQLPRLAPECVAADNAPEPSCTPSQTFVACGTLDHRVKCLNFCRDLMNTRKEAHRICTKEDSKCANLIFLYDQCLRKCNQVRRKLRQLRNRKKSYSSLKALVYLSIVDNEPISGKLVYKLRKEVQCKFPPDQCDSQPREARAQANPRNCRHCRSIGAWCPSGCRRGSYSSRWFWLSYAPLIRFWYAITRIKVLNPLFDSPVIRRSYLL